MSISAKNKFINPVDLEIMEAVIKAVCDYYAITEADLISRPITSEHTNVRRITYYLIATNTELKHWMIADRLLCARSRVTKSIDTIRLYKEIYAPTRNLIAAIINIANSFTKKHPWLIQ
jgi:chromosomal replication initiation ATPase DnaA